MGALGHFLEDEGVPTTQISLIRLHTEKIKPPRALWVSFELGRPFGIPNNSEFQSKVLLSALKLFEADKGPVIEDFPDEAPPATDQITTIACPVSFEGKVEELTGSEKIIQAMKQEIAGLQTWYDMAVKKRGRTTFGLSGMNLDQICEMISEFLNGNTPENPREDISLAYSVNLAIDDLKAYYTEAVTAQPGQESPSVEVLNKWFWTETAASKALYALREVCKKSEDPMVKLLGVVLIVPAQFVRKT